MSRNLLDCSPRQLVFIRFVFAFFYLRPRMDPVTVINRTLVSKTMTPRGACRLALAGFVTVMLLFVPLTPTSSLPNLHPPATTLVAGELGVDGEDAYAVAEGGLLVAPGSRVTVLAEYRFFDEAMEPGYSHSFHVTMKIFGPNGPIDTQTSFASESGPGAIDESGNLSVEFVAPEIVRDLTVSLEAKRFHSLPGSGSSLLSEAASSAPLSFVAVPDPVVFVSEGLVVGDSLEVGTIDFSNTSDLAGGTVDANEGHTFVSTDLGGRFIASGEIAHPAVVDVTTYQVFVTVAMSVNVEGGPNYAVQRAVFQESCNDWANHGCTLDEASRELDLEAIVPPSALEPDRVVDVGMHVSYHFSWQDEQLNVGDEFHNAFDSGRHLVVSA